MVNVVEPKTDPTLQERVVCLIEEAQAGCKPRKLLYSKKFDVSQST
jgi:hypothetical protein